MGRGTLRARKKARALERQAQRKKAQAAGKEAQGDEGRRRAREKPDKLLASSISAYAWTIYLLETFMEKASKKPCIWHTLSLFLMRSYIYRGRSREEHQ